VATQADSAGAQVIICRIRLKTRASFGYREAQKRIEREAWVAVVAVVAADDQNETVYDVHLKALMG
jgi:hypothetical protein